MTDDPLHPSQVLHYWFGADERPLTRLWFQGTPEIDAEIRARFGPLHAQAACGALDSWLAAPESAVALMVVLDQFSRHLYRGEARMFAWDAAARGAARAALREEARLSPAHRAAISLCLLHAEDAQTGAEAVAGLAALTKEPATRGNRRPYKHMLHAAQKHLRVLERFGRYPHRNALLGRQTTDEEARYLATEPSRSARSVRAHAAKRLKILVLHSFRQSGQRLAARTGLLRQAIEDIAELIYLDAPHPYLPDAAEQVLLTEDFGAVPDFERQRCWWNAGPDHEKYSGWEASLRFLDEQLTRHGADGVLGFSQGSAATGLLAALRGERLRFVICISGFPSRDEAHQMLTQPGTIDLPSLHIYGEGDILVDPERTRALAGCFLGAQVVAHPGGHFYPEQWPLADIRRFLLRFTEAPPPRQQHLAGARWAQALRANTQDPAALPTLAEVQALLPDTPEALRELLAEARGARKRVHYGAVPDIRAALPGDLAPRIWLAVWLRAPEALRDALLLDEDWAALVRLAVCATALLEDPGPVLSAVAARFAAQIRADEEAGRISIAAEAAPRPDSATDRVTGLGRAIAAALRPDLAAPRSYIDYRRRVSLLSRGVRLARRPRQLLRGAEPAPTTSAEVTRPRPVPVIPCPLEELTPLLSHLRDNVAILSPARFPRGIVMPDGRLDLCKQVVGPEGIGPLLGSLGRNAHVKRLLLGNNVVGRSGAEQIAAFIRGRESPITVWYIAGNEIDAAALAPICAALIDAPEVEGLWLKRNPLGPAAGPVLAELLRADTNLHTLDLVNTGLLDAGAQAVIEALADNRHLRHLYLSTNGLTAGTAAALTRALAESDRLESLYLSCNPLGDEGAAVLATALRHNRNLKRLGLASARIGPAGVDALCGALEDNQTLRFLDLGWTRATTAVGEAGNALGDAGAARLAALLRVNGHLRALDVSHNRISQAGLNHLSAALETNQGLVFLRTPQYGKATNPDSIARLQGQLARNRQRWGLDDDEMEVLRAPQSTRDILSVYRNRPATAPR